MTALHYSGHRRATEIKGDQKIEKRSRERNGHCRFKVQLEEDETAAQDRAGWRQVVCGLCSTRNNKA